MTGKRSGEAARGCSGSGGCGLFSGRAALPQGAWLQGGGRASLYSGAESLRGALQAGAEGPRCGCSLLV